MAFYLWMFPLLFIFHDMEEIIGLVPWIHLNETLLAQKTPAILKIHKGITTEGFALAVFKEFIIVLSITLLAYSSQSRALELVWLGGFVAFALHLLLHIGQSILLRKYIPALITSILCFPISAYLITDIVHLWQVSTSEFFLFSLVASGIVIINLPFALWLGKNIPPGLPITINKNSLQFHFAGNFFILLHS